MESRISVDRMREFGSQKIRTSIDSCLRKTLLGCRQEDKHVAKGVKQIFGVVARACKIAQLRHKKDTMPEGGAFAVSGAVVQGPKPS